MLERSLGFPDWALKLVVNAYIVFFVFFLLPIISEFFSLLVVRSIPGYTPETVFMY